MARNTLTKDELRHDPVQDWTFHAIDFAYQRRKLFSWAGAAVIALIVGAVGYYYYGMIAAGRVANSYNVAEAVFRDDTLPQAERLAKTREAFKHFLADHDGSSLAPYAWLHLAGLEAAGEKPEEAKKAYERAIELSAHSPSLQAIARTALAKLHEDQGDLKKSSELYNGLTALSYGDLAEFSLARIALAENKPDEARARLEALQQQYPDSALSTLAKDTLYFVH